MAFRDLSVQAIVSELAADLDVDVCTLYQISADGSELILVASHGLDASAVGYRMPIGRGLTGRVARTGKVVAIKEPDRDPDYHHVHGSGEERFRTFLGIPIRNQNQIVGVLVVQTVEAHLYQLREVAHIHEAGRHIEALLRTAA
jgi:L-methionine (R)-S-oxide reductase